MSIAERPSLYTEEIKQSTATEDVDRCVSELKAKADGFAKLSVGKRIELAKACLEGLNQHAEEWVEAACTAKGLGADSPYRAEEVAAGPLATARYLRLLIQSLTDIERQGRPELPGGVETGPDGQLKVQVMPAKGLFDSLTFMGFKSHNWMQKGVTRENLREQLAKSYQGSPPEPGIALILGAGNVSSIPPTDAFAKLFDDGKVVLLKMNPVNEYLGPIFAKCFASLVDAGYLRIIYGGADVGSHAVNHADVDEVHITGSVYSHDMIVWGPPGEERERRKAEHDPVLKKKITSELGNVTPWICVPGPYSDKELRFQAENLASMVTNNASFNCVAPKMIVTWKQWKDRDRYVSMTEDVLNSVPRRKAYYPGALERYEKFAGKDAPEGDDRLPFTVVRDIDPSDQSLYCQEESFVCVIAETALDAASEGEFLEKATAFCNEELWGTLAAGIMVHPKFRKQGDHEAKLQRAIADLRYGTVGINYWPALSYAMMTPPWGGYPDATLEDTQSGIGWVHNTFMLDGIEKTVLEGPLTLSPKPFWFPSNRQAEQIAWKVTRLYHSPSAWKLPGIFASALRA